MSAQAGDEFPAVEVQVCNTDALEKVSTGSLFADKKVVLFGVPGAFTPTCHAKHLPGFRILSDAIRDQGVDLIACVSVNDGFVMRAWGLDTDVGDDILMLADGNGELARALGLEIDISAHGMGKRCRRFAAIIDNGRITTLNVEAPGAGVEVSSAETILEVLSGDR